MIIVKNGLKQIRKKGDYIYKSIVFFMGDMERIETEEDIWMDKASVYIVGSWTRFY